MQTEDLSPCAGLPECPAFPSWTQATFTARSKCVLPFSSADGTQQRGSFLGQKHPGGVLAKHACLYPGGKQCPSQAPCLFSLGGICFACFMGQSVLLHCPQQADSPFLSALRSLPWGSLSWPRYECCFIAHITIAISIFLGFKGLSSVRAGTALSCWTLSIFLSALQSELRWGRGG